MAQLVVILMCGLSEDKVASIQLVADFGKKRE
jgi:hypothetical protein